LTILNIFFTLGFTAKSDSDKKRDLKLSMFIATHSAIRIIDHLGELLKQDDINGSNNNPLSFLRLHRTKYTKLITHVIAPAYLTELIEDVGQNPYSIILDESTDISIHKYMAFCIRYYSFTQSDMVTDFLGFVEIDKATADILKNIFIQFLEQSKLNIKNLMGIGTDGASNLCGKNHSLFTLLKASFPNIVLIKCICHSLNLCSAKACEELPSTLEFLIRESRNWFSHSSLRQITYQSLFAALYDGKKPPKLVQLSTTRWLPWYGCVKAVIGQWLSLKTHFNIISQNREQTCYISRTLSDMYKDESILLYLMFLKPVLHEVTQVNVIFQGTNVDLFKAHSDLKKLLIALIRRVLKPNYISQIIKESTQRKILRLTDIEAVQNALRFPGAHLSNNCVDYGWQFETQSTLSIESKNINQQQLNIVKQRCTNFLLKLCHELCNRLPDNMSTIEKIEYFCPDQCFNSNQRPSFGELPLNLAGNFS